MRLLVFTSSFVVVVTAAACSKNSNTPTQPATSTSTEASEVTGSVTVPQAVSPAANASIRNADQPITLTVANAVSTRGANTYDFEVATDTGFANKVGTKTGIAEGPGGRTSVGLDRLPANADYYWHARAQAGGTAGPFTPARKFTVGPAITIDAPVPIAPLNGAQTAARPTFRVRNATRQGPSGTITYKFDVATSAAFSTILLTVTVPEGVNETGFTPASDLPINTPLVWRATALDAANNVSSPASDAEFRHVARD
jgi:hypothetical protein